MNAPLSAHASKLAIIRLRGQRDALLAALLDILPLIEYYNSAEHAERTKEAREIIAMILDPPDPLDWGRQ